tara:strand:- start:4130 stop:4525 length:396 start_codon:yes stop_codon:yes gene_type:complete
MSKRKGSRSERELFHMLWEQGFSTVRSAGSGSTTKPAPDLIASNGSRVLAIECKAIKGEKKYFPVEELEQLRLFSDQFGSEAWIAVRFDNKGWWFIEAREIAKSKGKSFSVTLDSMQEKGLSWDDFLGKII